MSVCALIILLVANIIALGTFRDFDTVVEPTTLYLLVSVAHFVMILLVMVNSIDMHS